MKLIHLLLLLFLASMGRLLAQQTATAVATVTAGFVTGVTVTSVGSGYTAEPTVTLTGGGGSGATAKAILSGDKVAAVIVLTAGSGYAVAPTVSIDSPPKPFGVRLDPVFKLTVEGPPGGVARVEWAAEIAGPWSAWTNLPVTADGSVLMDLSPGSGRRFYRVVSAPPPEQPASFVWIPPGTFIMGSPTNEFGTGAGWYAETQHVVTLTRGFWMSDHEVTQGEFMEVMGFNPSRFRWRPNHPVENVTQGDAIEYCRRLTDRGRAMGTITPQQAFRLPTEAEWEYAARAGSSESRYGDLDAIAWFDSNSKGQTQPVRQKSPNAWKLYDMLGNVAEHVSDNTAGQYTIGNAVDPTNPSEKYPVRFIARGNHANASSGTLRFAARERANDLFFRSDFDWVGFRVVLSSIR